MHDLAYGRLGEHVRGAPPQGKPPVSNYRAVPDPQYGANNRGRPVALTGSEPKMKTLDAVDAASLKTGLPDLRSGDTVKVHVKVVEGNKTRVQIFQGVVIARAGSGIGETFTVRKVSYGVGVERTFPLHTPIIEKIELLTRGDVRRAKLYYLRDLRGKAAKIHERRENVPTVTAAVVESTPQD